MWVERDTARGIGISGIFESNAEEGARTVGICVLACCDRGAALAGCCFAITSQMMEWWLRGEDSGEWIKRGIGIVG
jgi:tetrahydromethanopterin S-methyltransferase subunit E